MGLEEFDEAEISTFNDWKDFLKGQDYYAVKINY